MVRVPLVASPVARALVLAAAVGLAGCAKGPGAGPATTGSIGNKPVAEMTQGELLTAVQGYTARYERNRGDKATGLTFSQLLSAAGRSEQALAVMRSVAIAHPEDRDVLAAYGKAQAGAGDFKGALKSIRNAQRPDAPDWKLISAEGAIQDQLGNGKVARSLYRRALELAPNDASVLSNLGMSYVLEGDLRTAETYLKQAAAGQGADSRIRQNLALVVGLQGRFKEAEAIASRELSPQQADANLQYLRSMMSQRDDWKELNEASPAGSVRPAPAAARRHPPHGGSKAPALSPRAPSPPGHADWNDSRLPAPARD